MRKMRPNVSMLGRFQNSCTSTLGLRSARRRSRSSRFSFFRIARSEAMEGTF
ncbi:hypothetical protein ACLESD_33405 [Pyxidicoccus sp. 3LFB2]